MFEDSSEFEHAAAERFMNSEESYEKGSRNVTPVEEEEEDDEGEGEEEDVDIRVRLSQAEELNR